MAQAGLGLTLIVIGRLICSTVPLRFCAMMNSYSTANVATRPTAAAAAITATTSNNPAEKKKKKSQVYKVVIKIPSTRHLRNQKQEVRDKDQMNLQQLASTPVNNRHLADPKQEVHYEDQKNQMKTNTLRQLASTPVSNIVQAHSFSKKKPLSMREITHGWW